MAATSGEGKRPRSGGGRRPRRAYHPPKLVRRRRPGRVGQGSARGRAALMPATSGEGKRPRSGGGRRPRRAYHPPKLVAVDVADAVFAALSDPTRRSLYGTLGERREATATELARDLPVTRQAVQKHLGVLATAGLVATRRQGREVLYRPTPGPMSEALAWMAEVGAQWDDRLAALEEQLESKRPAH